MARTKMFILNHTLLLIGKQGVFVFVQGIIKPKINLKRMNYPFFLECDILFSYVENTSKAVIPR